MAYLQAQTQQPQAQQQGEQAQAYHDLHTRGEGYLRRIREVRSDNKRGRKAEPFLACSINAVYGPKGKGKSFYSPYDLIVVGIEAQKVIRTLEPAVKAGEKVFLSFKSGDDRADFYLRPKKDPSGRPTDEMEPVPFIKAHLLIVYAVWVDGKEFYRRPRNDQEQGQQQAQGDPQPAQPAAPENRKPAQQPQSRPAARPVQGVPAMAGDGEPDIGTACEDGQY